MTDAPEADARPCPNRVRGDHPAANAGTSREFLPEPATGRVFAGSRTVRATDVTPGGRLRFDALARYLQDVAEDDLTDAGGAASYGWLVRRCTVTVRSYPATGASLRLRTFCSAVGPRWAERTTTVRCESGDLMQARAVWVALSRSTGRPAPLDQAFHEHYGEATEGRRVSARLSHPAPPAEAAGRPWPLRAADVDKAGHVNNAIPWAAVEDVLAAEGPVPTTAEIEYHGEILPEEQPHLLTRHTVDGRYVWLTGGGHRLVSARLA